MMVDVNAPTRSRIERSPKDKILPIDCPLQPTWPTNKIDILYIGEKLSDFYVVFVRSSFTPEERGRHKFPNKLEEIQT